MTADPATPLTRCLRRVAADTDSDGRLLDRFRTGRDEVAFAELVARHARMVFGVCRRVLGNVHDAEDAFQAVFVVLVRRAGDLTGRDTVGDWLYGVAYRTALKARANAVKRRTKEAAAGRPNSVEPPGPDDAAVVDAELAALPAKYREPLVLCELEGRPRKEVAAALSVPEGTLSSRLAMGKRMLADRLRRRGFAVGVGVLGSAGVAGAVPPGLIESAVRSAAGTVPVAVAKLAAEVTTAMFLTKLRIGVVVLAAALLGGVAGLSALSHVTAAPEAKTGRPAMRDGVTLKELTDKWRAAHKALEGTWELQKTILDDKEQEFQFDYHRYTFAERTVKIEYKLKTDEEKFEGESSFTVNPTTSPPEMTIYRQQSLVMGIYELNGDRLRIAFHGISELERPRGFAVADKRVADLPLIVWEFKRKAPEKPQPANPPTAKVVEPAWKAEFDKAYGLKDGEVLKRVAPPYPESREAFYKFTHGERREGGFTYDRYFSVFHWKGGRVQFGSATVPVNPDEGLSLSQLLGHVGFSQQEVEGDANLLDTKVTGDFVLRTGADPAKVAARLEEILRKDCNLAAALTIREVEREVVVARGKYRSKPLPGKDENHIELYATDLQPPEAGNGGGGATFPDFFRSLGGFINRRLVNEVEGGPKTVSFHYNFRSLMVKDPNTGLDTYAEDTDPEKVLKNVSAQTGLTFTTEKRKVPVLFVEKTER